MDKQAHFHKKVANMKCQRVRISYWVLLLLLCQRLPTIQQIMFLIWNDLCSFLLSTLQLARKGFTYITILLDCAESLL